MLIIFCPNCERFGSYANKQGVADFTFWIECDDCKAEGKAPQQPAPSDKRSAKALGSRRVKPQNVVSQEVEEPAVNSVSIDDLELSVRASNALTNAGLLTVGAVAKLSKSDLLKLVGVGKLTAMQIGKTVEDFCFNYGRTKAGEADRY